MIQALVGTVDDGVLMPTRISNRHHGPCEYEAISVLLVDLGLAR